MTDISNMALNKRYLLRKPYKKGLICLTLWFSLALILSVVGLFFHDFIGIVGVILNPFYIYTLQQKSLRVLKGGFWIHLTLSGLISTIMVVLTALKVDSASLDSNAYRTYLTVLMVQCFYFIMTIATTAVYWKHCKLASKLELILKKGSLLQTDDDIYVLSS